MPSNFEGSEDWIGLEASFSCVAETVKQPPAQMFAPGSPGVAGELLATRFRGSSRSHVTRSSEKQFSPITHRVSHPDIV